MKKIVTIGGGTGSFGLLSELRRRKEGGEKIEISAIVAMSDSGGSSGILMDNYGVLPAGDLRQCLVALSPESDILRELFTFRYEDGFLKGHSFGNLFISTLEKISGDLAGAVKKSEKILNTLGRVYPVSFDRHELIAELENGQKIISEKNLDNANLNGLEKIYFSKEIALNPEIPKVLEEADLILINPGSFYTSIIPNFLVKDLVKNLEKTKAEKVLISNIVTEKNQTDNFEVSDFVEKLKEYTGFDSLDKVIYNINYNLENDEVRKRYEEEGKFFVKRDENKKYKNIEFVGLDLLKKPDQNDKKHLIRTDFKKVVDEILKK